MLADVTFTYGHQQGPFVTPTIHDVDSSETLFLHISFELYSPGCMYLVLIVSFHVAIELMDTVVVVGPVIVVVEKVVVVRELSIVVPVPTDVVAAGDVVLAETVVVEVAAEVVIPNEVVNMADVV